MSLLFRAIAAFVALSTMVAFVIPWLLHSQNGEVAVLTILCGWATTFPCGVGSGAGNVARSDDAAHISEV